MSDPRKPIDNGRSWKAEFLPGSPGEKAIESLGLRPDHLRHDLVAFDEQIESLTAEITRLREELAYANDQRRMMADIVTNPDPEVESLLARLAASNAAADPPKRKYTVDDIQRPRLQRRPHGDYWYIRCGDYDWTLHGWCEQEEGASGFPKLQADALYAGLVATNNVPEVGE